MKIIIRGLSALAPLAALTIVPSAGAVDGVIEISQAAALAGGITPGDEPDFPVSINVGGSYRLTSNLQTSDSLRTLIRVNADDVTVDLNGFALLGPNTCSGDPPQTAVECTAIGGENGLNAGDHARVTVLNGKVSGMGWKGIIVGDDGHVEGVVAAHNRNNGIETGDRAMVLFSSGTRNGNYGIKATRGSRIEACVAGANGQSGIRVENGGTVTGSTASANGLHGIEMTGTGTLEAGSVTSSRVVDNGEHGISIGGPGTISGNVSSGNGGTGIRFLTGSVIGNTVEGNVIGIDLTSTGGMISDNTVSNNSSKGIICNNGRCTVVRNTVSGSASFGLDIDVGSGYAHNVLNDNNGGNANAQMVGGVSMGTNVCGGNTTCP